MDLMIKFCQKMLLISIVVHTTFIFQRITAAHADESIALNDVSDLGKRINNLPTELQENILENLSYDDLQALRQEFLIERKVSNEKKTPFMHENLLGAINNRILPTLSHFNNKEVQKSYIESVSNALFVGRKLLNGNSDVPFEKILVARFEHPLPETVFTVISQLEKDDNTQVHIFFPRIPKNSEKERSIQIKNIQDLSYMLHAAHITHELIIQPLGSSHTSHKMIVRGVKPAL